MKLNKASFALIIAILLGNLVAAHAVQPIFIPGGNGGQDVTINK